MRLCFLACCLVPLVALTFLQVPSAGAGIRVEEDEVFFTLWAPEAKTVYLVGDFNNWNPTIEKMEREGELFRISLFLVEGEYRYKFVVDGKWINDPDNPPSDPQRGSPLFLVDKAGELMLKEDVSEDRASGPLVEPSARYIGVFISNEGDFEENQVIDLNVGITDRMFSSHATFKTESPSWKLSPLESDFFFDKGRLETQVWRAHIAAFEDDTVWTSSDPFTLVGSVGIHQYNFGYGKRGLALDLPLSGRLGFKAVYADRISGETAPPLEGLEEALSAFASSPGTDTTLYAYSQILDDSDAFGMEVRFRLGSYEIGFARRSDQGIHPGFLNQIVKKDTLFETTTFRTRERWKGSAVWMGGEITSAIHAAVGYGRGNMFVNRYWKSISTTSLLEAVGSDRDAERWDSEEQFQNSHRIRANIDYRSNQFQCAIGLERDEFDFEAGLYPVASAVLFRAGVDAAYSRKQWTASAHIEYTDQDYGNTPTDFHFDSPLRNFWLGDGDRLLPETIAGFDLDSYSLARLSFSWDPAAASSGKAIDRLRLSFRTETGMVTGGVMESFEHGFVRIFAEGLFDGRFYLQADSRGAVYDKSGWGDRKTFMSGYLEAGYRLDRLELSIGYGLDPVILDPVRNEYFDIGRTEHLRKAVSEIPTREDATELKDRLYNFEHSLEEDHSIKLECILLF